jgi:inosose dehydratase
MRLAFSVPTSSAAEREFLFSHYRDCGYAGLQLKADQYLHQLDNPDEAAHLAEADPGRFSGIIFGGMLDEQGQESLSQIIEFAARVHSERIIFWHGLPREQVTHDDLPRFARILSRLGLTAQTRGVRLSLHHHYGHPVMFCDDIERFFEHVQPDSLGLTIDTAHLWMAGEDEIGPAIERFSGILDNVHLKDCRDDAPGERLASGGRRATSFMSLGHGEMNFDPIFQALHTTGYSGWLCADEESGADIGESLTLSHDFITQRLEAAQAAMRS